MIEKHLPDKVLLLGYWSSVVEIIKNLLWISLIESKTKEISENVYQDLYSIARDFFKKKSSHSLLYKYTSNLALVTCKYISKSDKF